MEHDQLILSAKDVNIRFNLRGKVLHAIRGIDLDLYQGEVLAIVGESGSGKSVFTKSFMGLLDANGAITGGTIDYYGMADGKPLHLSDLKTEKDWLRVRGREIAMIMQDPMTSLNPLKTIGDQIMEAVTLHQGLKGAAAKEKTLEYLRDVGISDPEKRFKQYPHEFSGGQRQRIGIARSLIMEPEFIIADEPISALDVSIRAQVLNLMSKLQKERGLTYLFIAHDLSVMRFICDRIAVIHKGVIVELSETEKLFAHPLHPYTRALLSAIPMPDPESEREKVLEVYDPSCHHYETDKPVWTEIEPGHFIMANQEELAEYRKRLENN